VSRYWLVRKTICIIGYFGGLRNAELRSIEFGQRSDSGEPSFESDKAGYWFRFQRAKQRGMPEWSLFCVPRRQDDWDATVSSSDRNPVDYDPASVIDLYLDTLQSDFNLSHDKMTGPFFNSAHGLKAKAFRRTPMGKNLIAKVGFEFATELGLPNPLGFTGHCWRRSCGTNASDAGVNVTTLMAQLGWATPKTAIGYVKKSRLTSFQMSMFLSNMQRQNKDLDEVLGKFKPSFRKLSRNKSAYVTLTGSSVSENLASPVSALSNVAPVSASVSSVSASLPVHSSVEHPPQPIVPEIKLVSTKPSLDQTIVGGEGNSDIGGGSGEQVRVGDRDDVVVDLAGSAAGMDPRVSAILSNLRPRGDLHVHFHFGH
jgi:hypothetical protein